VNACRHTNIAAMHLLPLVMVPVNVIVAVAVSPFDSVIVICSVFSS